MMTFLQACRAAIRRAQMDPGCAFHVNAVVSPTGSGTNDKYPWISGYSVSNWTDGTTVRTVIKRGSVAEDVEGRYIPEEAYMDQSSPKNQE